MSLAATPLERETRESARLQQPSNNLYEASNEVSVNILLWALRVYRAVFSPLMPFGCKFYPSCSQYASEAIARHGALRGMRLAALRLLRCRPFTRGGFDPVPECGHIHTHETGAGYTYSPQDRTDLHS